MNKSTPSTSRWFISAIAVVFLGLFLSIMAMAYTDNLPTFLAAIPNYDKPGHLILYALATYLGHRVLNYRRLTLGRSRVPLFPALFAIFTVVEECIQYLSPYRTLDAWDLIMSLVGIGVGLWLAEAGRDA